MKDRFNNAVGPQVRTTKKSTGKIIPLLAGASLVAGMQGATQYFAHVFHYQSALGVNAKFIYPTWRIIQWAGKWHNTYPDALVKAGSVGISITAIGLIGLVLTKMVLSNSSRANEYLHGSARWANINDIRAAGLLPRAQMLFQRLTGKAPAMSTGVYVGGWLDGKGRMHYLRHDGPEHVLTYAPTRSGKGVGLVIPTLLSWGQSAVITDLKGELWALTAGWRQQHAKNKVLRFEPAASTGSVCWNPLDEIRICTENEVGDVQNLATLIVDPDGKGVGAD